MVIDNADDINIFFDSLDEGGGSNRLIDYLPYSRKGNIIFTTRTKKAALRLAENNILQLDKLSKEEAKEVLRTRLLPEYQHQVNDVATVGEFLHMLAFFALAIVQAVAFVNSNGGGLSNYLELYRASEQNATELLSEEFEDNGRYRETENPVATTWYISFEQIRKNDTLAADLLSFMACMANNDIPVSMLPASSLSIAQTKAIGTLEAYAFIQRQLQEDASAGQQVQERQIDTFGIHPLVHLATRSWLKKLNQWDVWVEKAITRMLELVPDGDHITREVWTPYLPHAIHVSSMLTVNDANPKAELVDRVGRCQQTLGQYKAMEKTFRELLKYDDATLGPKHMNTLACLSHLGEALRGQGKYTEAKQIHRQTLQLTEEVFGKEHTETLTSKACLGLTLIDLGQYKEAEQMHREELALREKVSGKEHSYTLTSMNNLAMALEKQGKYKEAEQMHREELALTEKVSGKEHSHTLISMDNLAIALDGQGKHIEAEQLHRKALKLKEKVLGREHPSTLLSVNNLAITLGGQGKNKEAEKMHREELALREKVSGKEHPDTLTSMHNLALALSEQEKYTEAEPLHRKALRLREKVLGGEHPETLACMNELAVALEKQGKFEEAEQTQRSTLALREKVLGIEHPDTLRSVRWLANILKQQNRYKDALPLYKRAYEGNKKTLGSDHPYTRNSADWYAFAEAMVYGRPSSLRESSTFEEAYESSDDIFISDLLEARIYVEAEAPTRQEGDGRPSVSDSDDSVEGGVSLS
jgi:tetratricopeptide (TPR) repeat protein